MDEVIALIRKSKSPQIAKEGLMKKLGLSAIQAQAILDMRLQRLTALERDKILDERKELIATVKRLKEILDKESLTYEVQGVYGVYDIVLKLSSDNAEKLRSIITNNIRKISKVQSTLTMMVIEEQENL